MPVYSGVNPALFFRSDLMALQPYEAEKAPPGVVKLDANESPYDLPPALKECLFKEMPHQFFNRYPDPQAQALRRELADYLRVDSTMIMVGNGSDELILNLMLAFAGGGRVIISTPTFSMYAIHARIAGAEPVECERREDFSLDVDTMIATARSQQARLAIVCTPNNPTGNAVSRAEIQRLLAGLSCPLVVDEAYIEFGGETTVSLLPQYPHLIILRTLSKAFGLAGLRIGYLVANPEVIALLNKIKQPFNLNSFSQLAGKMMVRERQLVGERVREIIALREQLRAELAALPAVTVYPSEANFLYFTTPYAAKDLYVSLAARGVLVRYFHHPRLANGLRVTVGAYEENKAFVAALRAVLEEKSSKKNLKID